MSGTPVKRIVGGGSLLSIAGSGAFGNGIMYDRPWLSVIAGLLTVATIGALATWSRAEAKRVREREPEDDVASPALILCVGNGSAAAFALLGFSDVLVLATAGTALTLSILIWRLTRNKPL